ncbi:MAG: ArnT family glycosyltransferase, partial [Myxococcota bacterium]
MAIPWVCGERWYSDASYYQAIATQMAREGGGAWWSPMQGDLPYFNKPPLAFWMHGALVKAFGDADWAAHLPEGVAFVGVCLLAAWLARRLHGPLVGVLAGCVMALTNDWIVRVGNFKLDALHTLFVFGAIACWVRACVPAHGDGRVDAGAPVRGAPWGTFVGAGVLLGAALMTKPFYGLGAAALVLPWLWWMGLLTARRAAQIGMSVAIGMLIATPWYASMVARYGHAFVQAHVHEQTVQRAAGEMHDAQSWTWYLKLIAGTLDESIEPRKMWLIYAAAVAGMIVVALRRRDRGTWVGGSLAALWLV